MTDEVRRPLTPFCELCGRPRDDRHAACFPLPELEAPRYCPQCGRRMVVQVVPTGWSARCVEHGVRTG